MAHDVFISYSSKDKPTADAVCAMLERHGLRCWIAPRDVLPGDDWAGSIIDAIAGAKVFILVFSGYANASAQVKREVERAANHELPIIPFRIENVPPNRSLEFFISTPHWLDAYSPPLDEHIRRLTSVVDQLVAKHAPHVTPEPAAVPQMTPPKPEPLAEPPPPPSPAVVAPPQQTRPGLAPWMWLGGALAVALVLGVVLFSNASRRARDASELEASQAVIAVSDAEAAASAAAAAMSATPPPADVDRTAWARATMPGRWGNLSTQGCSTHAWRLAIDGDVLHFGANGSTSDETIDSISSSGEIKTHTSPPGPKWSYALDSQGGALTVTDQDTGNGETYTRCPS